MPKNVHFIHCMWTWNVTTERKSKKITDENCNKILQRISLFDAHLISGLPSFTSHVPDPKDTWNLSIFSNNTMAEIRLTQPQLVICCFLNHKPSRTKHSNHSNYISPSTNQQQHRHKQHQQQQQQTYQQQPNDVAVVLCQSQATIDLHRLNDLTINEAGWSLIIKVPSGK